MGKLSRWIGGLGAALAKPSGFLRPRGSSDSGVETEAPAATQSETADAAAESAIVETAGERAVADITHEPAATERTVFETTVERAAAEAAADRIVIETADEDAAAQADDEGAAVETADEDAAADVDNAIVETADEDAAADTDTESTDEPVVEHDTAVRAERVQPSPPVAVAGPVDEQEIRRRRDVVRTLFNDFWSLSDDKPPTFADRLNQAEPYLNERLSALGEPWRLDATNRKLLGLPPQRGA